MKIKGYIAKKEPTKYPTLEGSIEGVVTLVQDLQDTKKEIVGKFNEKIIEIEEIVDKSEKILNTKVEDVEKFLEDAENKINSTALEALDYVKEVKKGDPGIDADMEKVVEDVLARIPIPKIDEDKLLSSFLERVPKLNETSLLKKFLKQIPKSKADLKIIQESFETDPMSVIDKIMALPEGKFKIKSSQIDGLEQTIRAFHNQLGRGYLHGGGISNITGLIQHGTNVTITGAGTASSPYVINSTGGGGGTPAGPDGAIQFNNSGMFGGIANLFWDNGNYLLGVSQDGSAPDAQGYFSDVGGLTGILTRLNYVDNFAGLWGVHTSGNIYTDGKIGIAQPNPTVKLEVIGGGTPVMGLPYESAAFFNTDNKLGVYSTQATLAGNGSSITFGESVATDGSGYYPGFEIQNVNGASTAASYMRFNSLGRDINGSVQAAVGNILVVQADGKVGVMTFPSYTFDVGGIINTSTGYYVGGTPGFTGSGSYLNFDIVGGIIVNAS